MLCNIHIRYDSSADGDPILLSGLRCTGSEASLMDCVQSSTMAESCDHGDDVILSCLAGVYYLEPSYSSDVFAIFFS